MSYIIFCFNGEPKYCQVIGVRDTKMCVDFFDHNWTCQPFYEQANMPFVDIELENPNHYECMWNAARILSQGRAFSCIDFYQAHDKVLFGEIIFFPTTCMGGFSPFAYDTLLGQMTSLPKA